MWHLVFLAFFAFSVVRFAVYLGERRLYRPHLKGQSPMARTTYEPRSRRGNSDLVDIAGEIQMETEKAYQFYDGKSVVWLPKSQCEWDAESKTMTMRKWIALEKGLV